MTTIAIPQAAPAVLQPRQSVRNGLYPIASFTHAMLDLGNHVARYRTKEVGRFAIAIANNPGGAGAGQHDRGYGFFHSSPHASRLWAIVTVAGTNTTRTPSVRIRCATTVPATIGDVTFYAGQGPGTNTPAFYSTSGPLTFLDPATGLPAAVPPDTDLTLQFSDFDDGCLMSAVVYEESLPSDTSNGYVDPNVAVLAPIYDATRQGLATLLRNVYKSGGSHLFSWTSTATPLRSTSSSTDKNLIDNTSTGTPSASSAGIKLDLRNISQLRDAASGVHVVVRAFGIANVNGVGTVKLKSASGGVITLGPFTNSGLTWVSAAGYLPELDKHDFQFATASGTLSIAAVSIYLLAA